MEQTNGKSTPSKYTSADLKIMQSWPLERKIQVAQTRILEWGQHWGEDKIYVSFSGGKDSTVLLDLVRRVYHQCPAVFVDTGLEYPEIRKFVKTIQNVTWIKPKLRFDGIIEKYGYPVVSKETANRLYYAQNGRQWAINLMNGLTADGSMPHVYAQRTFLKWNFLINAPFKISGNCCNIMKKSPAHKYEKETGRHPIIGTMACESTSRKKRWLQEGCNAFNNKNPSSKPISFWTEQDILEYISRYAISYASIYGDIIQDKHGKYTTTGEDRTGCMFCMFGAHLEKQPNRFQRMQLTHPKQWEYCMKPVEQGGLGLSIPLDYIGCPWKNEEMINEEDVA